MNKITIIRTHADGTRTFRRWEMRDLVNELQGNRFSTVINSFRADYPLIMREPSFQRTSTISNRLAEVPRICFATEFIRINGKEQIQGHSPLLLLTISNLRNALVAEDLRNRAEILPYTRLAFVGTDEHSLNIVCELHPLGSKPLSSDDFTDLLLRGFAILRKVYSDHLRTTVDIQEPSLSSSCFMSHDFELFYNPSSTPFPVNMLSKVPSSALDAGYAMPPQVENRDERHQWRRVFIDNLRKAQSKNFTSDDPVFETLLLLARYCHETGMPQALAESFVILNGEFSSDEPLIRDTFATEYEKELRRVNPQKHLSDTAQMIIRTNNFLNVHFRFRRNVLNGIVEYRLNDGTDFRYHQLTEEVQNTMTIMALESGLNSWDKDLKRYIHSKRIPEFDPINAYLEALPKWDGKNRIADLACRVPTDTPDWQRNFHLWMRSMVAQWMGRDEQHGNAIAPILIGAQATGKSSFCRILLPEALQEYYNDSIHFKDDKSVFLALSSFALINIDEFDSLSRSQQPLLKYLLSKSDVKYRASYRNYIEQHKRYASFIATTNNLHPLNDPTGSRRFICVRVNGSIDFATPIDHQQVYAQLRDEVTNGERYWFTKEEADIITLQNQPFQKTIDLAGMINHVFRQPDEDDTVTPLPLSAIIAELQNRYPTTAFAHDVNMQVGRTMKSLGYEQIRGHRERKYRVVIKS